MNGMNEELRTRQIEQLYEDSHLVFYLSFMVIALYKLVLYELVPAQIFTNWCIWFTAGIILRGITLLKFRNRHYYRIPITGWMWIHAAICLYLGLVQAYLILLFDPLWPTYSQVAFWMLIAGVIAVLIKGFTAVYTSYTAFSIPMIAASLYSIYALDIAEYMILFWMFIPFGIGVHITAYNAYRNNTLRIKNELSLIKANRKLETLASRDPLTNLPNRRAFDDYYHSEWERHKRSASVLSLLVIDVDHFKQFNDTYGHAAGDNCLIRLANCINECLNRPADKVVRYGGEEFLVLLPDTSTSGSLEVAERILRKVRALAIPHSSSGVADIITVSIGLATTDPTDDKDQKQLFHQADEQLYIAKASGRNRLSRHPNEINNKSDLPLH